MFILPFRLFWVNNFFLMFCYTLCIRPLKCKIYPKIVTILPSIFDNFTLKKSIMWCQKASRIIQLRIVLAITEVFADNCNVGLICWSCWRRWLKMKMWKTLKMMMCGVKIILIWHNDNDVDLRTADDRRWDMTRIDNLKLEFGQKFKKRSQLQSQGRCNQLGIKALR